MLALSAGPGAATRPQERASSPAGRGHFSSLSSLAAAQARPSVPRRGACPSSIEAQVERLEKAGCEPVFSEHQSGGKRDRKELERALDFVRKGDVLVVCKIDRLSRSLIDLLNILEQLKEKGAGFESLGDNIETHSAAGKMMLNMLGAFAQFERELIRERVMRGLDHARANGRVGGSKPMLDEARRIFSQTIVEGENALPVVLHADNYQANLFTSSQSSCVKVPTFVSG
jgi:DNA invertase Pin-like site-specific DNA recombinase